MRSECENTWRNWDTISRVKVNGTNVDMKKWVVMDNDMQCKESLDGPGFFKDYKGSLQRDAMPLPGGFVGNLLYSLL